MKSNQNSSSEKPTEGEIGCTGQPGSTRSGDLQRGFQRLGKFVCFVAGPKVWTDQGEKSIEGVYAGEIVYSFDFSTATWTRAIVDRLSVGSYHGDFISITVPGEALIATGSHPFWVIRGENLNKRSPVTNPDAAREKHLEPGRWVAARDLIPGDELLTIVGSAVCVQATAFSPQPAVVYNLVVRKLKNFAVGSSGILVHNS